MPAAEVVGAGSELAAVAPAAGVVAVAGGVAAAGVPAVAGVVAVVGVPVGGAVGLAVAVVGAGAAGFTGAAGAGFAAGVVGAGAAFAGGEVGEVGVGAGAGFAAGAAGAGFAGATVDDPPVPARLPAAPPVCALTVPTADQKAARAATRNAFLRRMNDPAYTIERGRGGRTAGAPNLSKKGRSASAQGIFYRAPPGRQAKTGAPSSSGLTARRGTRSFDFPSGRLRGYGRTLGLIKS
jgi:hypothetical protein